LSWLRTDASFSFQELLKRLEHRLRVLTYGLHDLPQRQKTLRNTLTWSYELLTHEEQRLFRALAIFASGCTVAAAEFVCGSTGDFLDVLTSLLEKNLLQRVESHSRRSRLKMLETLREYGQEHLQASAEYQQVQRLHASYYLLQAEQAEQHFTGAAGAEWLDQLEQEYDNVRRALRWYLECQEWENALRLGGALRYFWILNGHGHEGYQWMTDILIGGEAGTVRSRAKALLTASMLAHYHGEYTRWSILSQESLQLFQALGDRGGMAEALKEIGAVVHWQGKLTEAHELYTKSIALFQEIGDQLGIADTKLSLARVLHAQMVNREARQLGQESLHLFSEIANNRGIARTLSLLAFIAGYDQEHSNAIKLAEKSLSIFKAIGEQWEVARQLHYVAELALRQNDAEHALACVEESLHISQQIGNREAIARAYHLLAQVERKRQGITIARPLLERSLVLYEEIDNQEGTALVLLNMAQEKSTFSSIATLRCSG
jgi:tetratricopeptide (TPR) repeat protein